MKRELSHEDIINIAESASRAIYVWADCVSDYDPSRWPEEPYDNYVFFTCRTEDDEPFDVTPELIRRGYDLAIAPGSGVPQEAFIGVTSLGPVAIDALIQMAVFGQHVYE
jgi:hypothetical protein